MSKYGVIVVNGTKEKTEVWKGLPQYNKLKSFMGSVEDSGIPVLHSTAIEEAHLTPIRGAGEGTVESFSLHHNAEMITEFQFPPTAPCIPEWTKVTPPLSPEEIYSKTGKTADSLLWDRLFSSGAKVVRLLFDKNYRRGTERGSIDYSSERLDAVLRSWGSVGITSVVILGDGVQDMYSYIKDHKSNKIDFRVIPIKGLITEELSGVCSCLKDIESLDHIIPLLEASSSEDNIKDAEIKPSRIIT